MGLPDSIIPEERLPQCWSDDVRMNALFAPFRLKTANPESWDMKMKFWSPMLRVWCTCKKNPIVSASDAKVAFQRKARTPACIEIVVEEMYRNGELVPLSKYQQILHNGPEGWVRWGTRLAFKPATFAFSAVTSLLPARQATDSDGLPKASIDSTMRFVLESAVKEQATDLLNSYPPGVERIGTIEELMRLCQWEQGRDTFEVLLGYLVSQGSAVKKGDVVKLAEPNKKASPVTASDEAMVKLLSAETRLSRDAERLSRDLAAAEADARAALQLGNRVAAKNHLRRKHQLSSRLLKCDSALENVRQLLLQMRDVDINSAIVDTYKTTTSAMKHNMKQGLNEDDVHDTMDDLRDVMESINEVEKALAGPAEDLDQAELEQELKDLLAGAGPGGGASVATPQTVPVLPSPPKETPARKVSEREFVFDCEERVLAELNELGTDDVPKEKAKEKVAVADSWAAKPSPKSNRPSQSWYPPSQQCLRPDEAWNNNLGYGEVKLDDRLHPGQPIKIDFSTPPRLYNTDFVVADHKMADGVWLYNSRDNNSNLATNPHIPPGIGNVPEENRPVPLENRPVPLTNRPVPLANRNVPPGLGHVPSENRVPPGFSHVPLENRNALPGLGHVPLDNRQLPSENRNAPPGLGHVPLENRILQEMTYIPTGSDNIPRIGHEKSTGISHTPPGTSHTASDLRHSSMTKNLPSENSTEYFSESSPGKTGGSFQMAPGGERKHSNPWNTQQTPLEDLEARLRNLRGFNL